VVRSVNQRAGLRTTWPPIYPGLRTAIPNQHPAARGAEPAEDMGSVWTSIFAAIAATCPITSTFDDGLGLGSERFPPGRRAYAGVLGARRLPPR